MTDWGWLGARSKGGSTMRRLLWPVLGTIGLILIAWGSVAAFSAPGGMSGQPVKAAQPRPGQAAPAQGTPTPTASPTPAPPCGLYWRVVNSPNPGSYDITWAVGAGAANDVWAVGFYFNGG